MFSRVPVSRTNGVRNLAETGQKWVSPAECTIVMVQHTFRFLLTCQGHWQWFIVPACVDQTMPSP